MTRKIIVVFITLFISASSFAQINSTSVYSFFGIGDVPIITSVIFILLFTSSCVGVIWYIFKTGYRIKN